MADRYFDLNGSTAGFGTLTGAWNTTSAFWSTSSAGTAVPGTFTFTNADRAFFGAAGATATAGTATIADGVTVTLNGITTANLAGLQTITRTTSGALTIAGTTPSITVNSVGGLTISAPIGGTTAWTSNGSSTLSLTVANGFSAGMSISSGIVQVGNNSALGTGTVTMTGGKLSSSSTTGYTLANALSLNGTITLSDATNFGLLTFSGPTTIAGTTSLSIPANYVLMQGVFGGTGAFTLSSGELDLEGATGTKSGGTTISGGTLYLGFGKTLPDQLGSDSLTINSGSAFFCGSSNSTITNTITGSGGFLYARPRNAVVTFSNASAYTGSFRIFAGASDGAGTTTQGMTLSTFPTSATNFTFQNQNTGTAVTQTFKYTGTASPGSVTPLASTITITPTVASSVGVWQHSPSNGTATMSIAGVITSNASVAHTLQLTNDSSGLLSFSGGITQSGAGAMALTKTGTGPVTLSGAGTNSGTVSVSAGTLNANSATALGAASSTAAISVTSGATLSLGAALNYSSPGRTTSISGTGVSGVDAGCLVLANAGPLNLGAINATNNTYIRGTTTTQLTSAIAWSGSGGLRLGAATGTTATFSGAISVSSGTLTAILFGRSNNPDLGTVVLGTTNTFTAPAQIDFGTLQIGSDANLGAAPGAATTAYLTIGDNTTLATTGTFTLNANRGIALGPPTGSGTGTIDVAGSTTLTYAGVIANNSTGTGALVKSGTGTLVLSGNNTYTGATTLNAGTLVAGRATNAFGLGGSPSFTGGLFINGGTLDASVAATVDLRAYLSADFIFAGTDNFKVSTLANVSLSTVASSVAITTNGSGILWFDAPVSEPSGLKGIIKKGNGILRLAAATSSYGGGTEIQAGTLQAGGGGWSYVTGQYLGAITGVTIASSAATLQTMTALNQRGRLSIASLTNSAGGTIKIGG